jgi:hypothetical protein
VKGLPDVLIPLTAFFLFGALFMILELRRAPRGFEGESGFHPLDPSLPEKDAVATSPASIPQDPPVSSLATNLPCHPSVARQSETQ